MIHHLQHVCEKYQIVDKIQLNTDVSEVQWLEDEQLWGATLLHMMFGTGDKGLIKQRVKQTLRVTLRVITLLASIVGLYSIRKDVRGGLRAFGGLMKQKLRVELLRLLGWVEKGIH